MESIRTFLAIAIEFETKRALDRLVARLRPRSEGVRWIDTANFHITMAFLGDVEVDQLSDLFETVATICTHHDPFDITLAGFGAFPSERRPRILQVGVREGAEEMKRLEDELAGELELLGYRRDLRAFVPHVTVGRVKGPLRFREGKEETFAELADWTAGTSHVVEVQVMGSKLSPKGPTYSTLGSFPLGK